MPLLKGKIKISQKTTIARRFKLGLTADSIAPDKAVYCVFTQFRGPENTIKFISVRTKTQ